ncbi:MAG: hypothetical protein R3C03_03125 [Pirellulaceae bacterium]
MIRLSFAAVVAITALAGLTQTAQAQSGGYQYGYGIGAGVNHAFPFPGMNACGVLNREEPPFFAKYPPVYYSHIVRRPYGISPYAAPAGIRPVEMDVPVSKPC